MDTTTSHLRLCLPRLLMKDGMRQSDSIWWPGSPVGPENGRTMKLSKSKIIGLIALLAVVGVVCGTLVWRQSQPAPAEPTEQVSITGYLGGEKIGLFDDAKFKALAAKQGHCHRLSQGRIAGHDGCGPERHGLPVPLLARGRRIRQCERRQGPPPKATSSSTHRLCYTRTRPWRTGS